MPRRRTKYQQGHRPTSVTEVLCTAVGRDDEMCTTCGRWPLRSARPHRPNADGAYGWIEHYADGTTFQTAPGERVRTP